MYSSTYLSWFRRLLILGAVVAGLTASAAGARLDPGTPPDVRDVASSPAASATSPVARIIVQEQGRRLDLGLFGLGPSASSVKGVAPTWEHQLHSPATASQNPTAAGLKADGLRWQGIARVYEQQSVPASAGSDFAWGDWAIGIGAGLGLVLMFAVGLMVGRQLRHRVQPA
jgi:hypothetical protein